MMLVQSFIPLPVHHRAENKALGFDGKAPSIIAEGQAIYMTFALGDSILFCFSADKGKSFSTPETVSVLPNLSLGGGRGPQIVSANGHLIIAAADTNGNIYSFNKKQKSEDWEKSGRINDVAGVAKEAFVSLSSNNKGEVYAVWLDLRNNNKNKIVGAKSLDGGRTWSKNKIIYTSPDGTVCECCKPTVAIKNQMVVVMFRNWLKGNRDMYIVQSGDGGVNFGNARKLGEDSWKLNACPMDGGGLVLNNDNSINTVWRRQENIYTCNAGNKEEMISVGKHCAIAGNKDNRFIAFVNKGKVYCRKPGGITDEIGSGSYPQLAAVGTGTALCAWQDFGKVYYALLTK